MAIKEALEKQLASMKKIKTDAPELDNLYQAFMGLIKVHLAYIAKNKTQTKPQTRVVYRQTKPKPEENRSLRIFNPFGYYATQG